MMTISGSCTTCITRRHSDGAYLCSGITVSAVHDSGRSFDADVDDRERTILNWAIAIGIAIGLILAGAVFMYITDKYIKW